MAFSKWPDRPHWEYDTLRLGSDPHGTWLGVRSGTRLTRPGADFRTEHRFVVLVPEDAAFVASFYADTPPPAPRGWVEVYVDMTTPPVWDGAVLRAVDLDLDVIRGTTGRVWVDDEDEFADHRVRFDYPEDLVSMALESCARVRAAVVARESPYDGATDAHWLARLDAATMTP